MPIAAFLLALGLAGCSTVPTGATTAASAGCANLRSVVTNLEALRSWCAGHDDPAGAAAWMTGVDNSLKADTSADAATATRLRHATATLDRQLALLNGSAKETAMAQLPDALSSVIADLTPVRDDVCA
ncbi:hypothetical protein F1C12_03655 [Leifsonia shinshuensis]|uniref:Uncharacterized protein n=1 Tax=Leifsonia shinshuensis TaxID=150026 RepID=A0A7G6Y756_9MICO|nr:hypothetical protein F1C12_03655 [Leifsonia shinshuensis]